ncbi:ubiquitin conjugating enzyme [Aspergillus sclerotialis]|uniref:Ubiquitin conjugating enzyme n=1 Tax=Aspergillus sclerotialis TaxID=2070753 RepID=A0A3A2ZPI0_9EURO|nr:ubiquitin conjugating enzyme [Aspergillus sclerotialis]
MPPQTATTKRLLKESTELLTPSPTSLADIHATPINDNLYDWHFTIAGPPSPSVYSEGIYHGRIVLPPTYPLRPPSFRFLTPSGRFEVNREICLSISGHHEDTWQPAWGIRTALVAIRSFMDAEAAGQLGGVEASEGVRREFAQLSREWRCEVCDCGSNEEIMKEWKEKCREAGLGDGPAAEEGDDDERKDGRKEGDGESTKATNTTSEQPQAREQPHINSRPTTATSPELSTSRSDIPIQSRPSTNTMTSVQPPRTTVAPAQSSDGPWLDRAIVGVLVALVFMILRRIVNTDEVV